MANRTYRGPADRLAAYEAAVALVDGLDRKGAANPYTSSNGYMTSFLDADGELSLRLSPDDRDAFGETFETRTPVQYGKQMKDFVVVPDALLDDPGSLRPWFRRSMEWVETLRPK